MGFNYGLEKKNFDRQWAIMRKQYEDAGMSIEVLQAMYAGVRRGYSDHPEHRRPCRHRND